MNAGKRDRPFQYPEPFIARTACIHVFLQMPYRQMKGFARKLTTLIPGLTAADYTTLFCRIQRQELSLKATPEILAEDVIIAVESTRDPGHEPGRVDAREVSGQARLDQVVCRNRRRDQPDPRPGGHRRGVPDDRMSVPLLDRVQQPCGEEHRYTGCLAMGPTTETSSSMPSNNGRSSPGSRPGRMQQPARPGHPIMSSAAENGSKWGISDVVVDNHLRYAVEEQREFLHPETGLRGRSAGNLPGGDVPRDPDKGSCYTMLIAMVA